MEISRNLFDFDPTKDHRNLISAFGKASPAGPASLHHHQIVTHITDTTRYTHQPLQQPIEP
jgi:hypothetical protein